MPQSNQRAAGLYTVIAIKLGKGLLFLCLALGIYNMIDKDLQTGFDHLLRLVRLNPESAFFDRFDTLLQHITPGNVRTIAWGTFLYSLLLFIESGGLICRTFWAAWLAIGETAFFLPLEIFRLVEKYSLTVLVVLIINIAIVYYLVKNRNRLFHHHHPRRHHP